jgi:hypothetical protein
MEAAGTSLDASILTSVGAHHAAVVPTAPGRPHGDRKIFLYLDYNGVLNAGEHDMREEMCRFLVAVEHIHADVHVELLSKRRGCKGRKITMDEICSAGVLDLFNQITFTSERTGHDHQGDTSIEQYIYRPASRHHEAVRYEVFHGGKDQYIHSQHCQHSSGRIVFVDDKAQILRAVSVLTPHVCGIEMRRHHFYTDANLYGHVRNLRELCNAIEELCYSTSAIYPRRCTLCGVQPSDPDGHHVACACVRSSAVM